MESRFVILFLWQNSFALTAPERLLPCGRVASPPSPSHASPPLLHDSHFHMSVTSNVIPFFINFHHMPLPITMFRSLSLHLSRHHYLDVSSLSLSFQSLLHHILFTIITCQSLTPYFIHCRAILIIIPHVITIAPRHHSHVKSLSSTCSHQHVSKPHVCHDHHAVTITASTPKPITITRRPSPSPHSKPHKR